MVEKQKKLPIGIDSFSKIRRENFYYVDKTGLIEELLDDWGEVNLFTRPRRFGKSLNMDMLKSFFEMGTDSSVFEGLAIWKQTEMCNRYMGQYPVISLSFKDVGGMDYISACHTLSMVISDAVKTGDQEVLGLFMANLATATRVKYPTLQLAAGRGI